MSDLSGKRLGYLTLESKIGEGAFSEVYQAFNTQKSEHVACKIIHKYTDRIDREIKALQALKGHSNIVEIYSTGYEERFHYIEMELCQYSLEQKIREGFSRDIALNVMHQVLDGLEHAHNNGILHRDLKPENILYGKDGKIKICDFGLNKEIKNRFATHTNPNLKPLSLKHSLDFTDEKTKSKIAGTMHYMAPEQFEGRTDERTDIFAAGTVLSELLTGKRPIGTLETGDADLDFIINKCRRQEPSQRYQSTAELRSALPKVETKIIWDTSSLDNSVENVTENKKDKKTQITEEELASCCAGCISLPLFLLGVGGVIYMFIRFLQMQS